MIKTFDTKIYPLVFWVAIDETLEGLQKNFMTLTEDMEVMDLDDNYEPDAAISAYTVPLWNKKTKRNGILLYLVRDLGLNTIAHECYHAVNFFGQYLGIKEGTYDNDEPRAYLMGWLVESVYEFYKNYKEK